MSYPHLSDHYLKDIKHRYYANIVESTPSNMHSTAYLTEQNMLYWEDDFDNLVMFSDCT